jgi:hypothetical protein
LHGKLGWVDGERVHLFFSLTHTQIQTHSWFEIDCLFIRILVQAAPEKITIQLQTVCERYIMVRRFDSDTE